jgi:hypothetical protein
MSSPDETTAGDGAGAWSPPEDSASIAGAGQGNAVGSLVAQRPELAVGAAFVGGLLAARIIKRLGR